MKPLLSADQVRKRLAALDEFKKQATDIGAWDITTSVTGGLHGELADWPSNIRDGIYECIARDCKPKLGWHIKVVASGCFQDDPREPCYIRVIVQEYPPMVM